MKEREEHMLEKINLTIKMDPKITKIFENSQNVSCILLISFLCLVVKSKSQILLRKATLYDQRKARQLDEKELKDATSLVPGLKREIDELVEELDSKNEKIEEYERQAKILSNLFDLGVIDGEGNLIKKEENQDIN